MGEGVGEVVVIDSVVEERETGVEDSLELEEVDDIIVDEVLVEELGSTATSTQ